MDIKYDYMEDRTEGSKGMIFDTDITKIPVPYELMDLMNSIVVDTKSGKRYWIKHRYYVNEKRTPNVLKDTLIEKFLQISNIKPNDFYSRNSTLIKYAEEIRSANYLKMNLYVDLRENMEETDNA